MEPSTTQPKQSSNQQYYQNQSKRGYHQKRGNYRGGRGNYRQGNYRNQNNNYRGGYNQNSQYHQYQPQRQYINPYLAQKMIYQTEMYIYTKYRQLIDINTKNKGLSSSITDSSTFDVIKSFSVEDVHKSIKYGVWSSSKNGNQTLTNSFNLAKEKNGSVYLFFSCNGSGRFVGVARMKSPCDNEKSFEYWTQDEKWPGLFEVEWLFIKDVPFREFKSIIITMKDGETKPISNARDVQEVPFANAKTMVEIFENYQNTNTILEHFEYYDVRQDNYEKAKAMNKLQEQKPNEQ